VGLLQLAQGPELTVAEQWNGSQWVVQPTPILAEAKSGALQVRGRVGEERH
jgi:hypothetical protein